MASAVLRDEGVTMEPAYPPPFVPLLPSAGPALVGPFLFAVAIVAAGLFAVVTGILRGHARAGRSDVVIVDLVARPRAPEARAVLADAPFGGVEVRPVMSPEARGPKRYPGDA
jgi:hypothetical protein